MLNYYVITMNYYVKFNDILYFEMKQKQKQCLLLSSQCLLLSACAGNETALGPVDWNEYQRGLFKVAAPLSCFGKVCFKIS